MADQQSQNNTHGSSHDEAHYCLGRTTAVIGTFIREKDLESLDWFLGQLRGLILASEELSAEEQGNSTEVH